MLASKIIDICNSKIVRSMGVTTSFKASMSCGIGAAALAGLLLASPTSYAEESAFAVVNGTPCIDGICMGDPLEKHIDRMKWLRTAGRSVIGNKIEYVSDSKSNPFWLSDTGAKVRADKDTLAILAKYARPFGALIDDKGLRALTKVKAVCGLSFEFTATYLTESGNFSSVTFKMVPSEDRRTQNFLVTRLGRKIVGDFTFEQKAEIRKKLDESYGDAVYSMKNSKALYMITNDALVNDIDSKPGAGFSINPNVGPSIKQALIMDFANETMKHPLCANAIKMN